MNHQAEVDKCQRLLRPYCALCEAGLTVDRHGIHTTKTGGYAGMCDAQHEAAPK